MCLDVCISNKFYFQKLLQACGHLCGLLAFATWPTHGADKPRTFIPLAMPKLPLLFHFFPFLFL